MRKPLLCLAAAAALSAACKKRPQENIPQPEAQAPAVSTASPTGLLEAPGAYVRGTVDQVGKAKAAAAVYEKAAKDSLGAASGPGGGE